jgi:hypothetical protein
LQRNSPAGSFSGRAAKPGREALRNGSRPRAWPLIIHTRGHRNNRFLWLDGWANCAFGAQCRTLLSHEERFMTRKDETCFDKNAHLDIPYVVLECPAPPGKWGGMSFLVTKKNPGRRRPSAALSREDSGSTSIFREGLGTDCKMKTRTRVCYQESLGSPSGEMDFSQKGKTNTHVEYVCFSTFPRERGKASRVPQEGEPWSARSVLGCPDSNRTHCEEGGCDSSGEKAPDTAAPQRTRRLRSSFPRRFRLTTRRRAGQSWAESSWATVDELPREVRPQWIPRVRAFSARASSSVPWF